MYIFALGRCFTVICSPMTDWLTDFLYLSVYPDMQKCYFIASSNSWNPLQLSIIRDAENCLLHLHSYAFLGRKKQYWFVPEFNCVARLYKLAVKSGLIMPCINFTTCTIFHARYIGYRHIWRLFICFLYHQTNWIFSTKFNYHKNYFDTMPGIRLFWFTLHHDVALSISVNEDGQ